MYKYTKKIGLFTTLCTSMLLFSCSKDSNETEMTDTNYSILEINDDDQVAFEQISSSISQKSSVTGKCLTVGKKVEFYIQTQDDLSNQRIEYYGYHVYDVKVTNSSEGRWELKSDRVAMDKINRYSDPFEQISENQWKATAYMISYRPDNNGYRFYWAIHGMNKTKNYPKWGSCSGKSFNKDITNLYLRNK